MNEPDNDLPADDDQPTRPIDKFFKTHYDMLRRFARKQRQSYGRGLTLRTTGILHEAYVSASANFKDDDIQNPSGFGWRLIRNVLVTWYEKKGTKKRGQGARPASLDELRAAGVEIEGTEDPSPSVVFECLEKLKKAQKEDAEAFDLRSIQDLSMKEAAAHSGVSESTHKARYRRATIFLKACVDWDEIPPVPPTKNSGHTE